MDDTSHGALGLRVVRGRADADELAALTVVLLALRARADTRSGNERRTDGSRWWRSPVSYRSPCSWQ